jgi:hypothetical protein
LAISDISIRGKNKQPRLLNIVTDERNDIGVLQGGFLFNLGEKKKKNFCKLGKPFFEILFWKFPSY